MHFNPETFNVATQILRVIIIIITIIIIIIIIIITSDNGIKIIIILSFEFRLNLLIKKGFNLAFLSFFGAAYLCDEVTVLGCPLQWKVIPFTLIEMNGWKLIALFDIKIKSSDTQIMSKRK